MDYICKLYEHPPVSHQPCNRGRDRVAQRFYSHRPDGRGAIHGLASDRFAPWSQLRASRLVEHRAVACRHPEPVDVQRSACAGNAGCCISRYRQRQRRDVEAQGAPNCVEKIASGKLLVLWARPYLRSRATLLGMRLWLSVAVAFIRGTRR